MPTAAALWRLLFKQCGYDGIFFEGISETPVYLEVIHGKAALRDAAALWGQDTHQTEQMLRAPFGDKPAAVACIGAAGENLSLIAGISNDYGRLAARSGLGAVMGSKRLKAIVVWGAFPLKAAQPQEMKRLTQRFARYSEFQPPFLNGGGTRRLATLMRILPLQLRMDGMLYKFF